MNANEKFQTVITEEPKLRTTAGHGGGSVLRVSGMDTALRRVSLYLVGVGGVWAWVPHQSRELLLQPVVRAVSQAVGDAGRQQDPRDGHDGDQGEHHELGGVVRHCLVRQRLDAASLQTGEGAGEYPAPEDRPFHTHPQV